jgi:hypothetical protein
MSSSRLSAAGAANMRFNAQTHGLTSKQAVIRGEDPAAYELLKRHLFEEYQPATPTETTLVDLLTKHDWRLQRAHQIEILTFNYEIDGLFPGAAKYPAAASAMAMQVGGKNLDQVRRYMTTIERSYFRTLKELQHARQVRVKSTVSQNAKALESLFWNDPPTVSQNPTETVQATQKTPGVHATSPTVSQNSQATQSGVPDDAPTVSQNPATTSNESTELIPALNQTPSVPEQSTTVSQNSQVAESVLKVDPSTVSQNPAAQHSPTLTEPTPTVSRNPQVTESVTADRSPAVSQNPELTESVTTDDQSTVSQNPQATESVTTDHSPTVSQNPVTTTKAITETTPTVSQNPKPTEP